MIITTTTTPNYITLPVITNNQCNGDDNDDNDANQNMDMLNFDINMI